MHPAVSVAQHPATELSEQSEWMGRHSCITCAVQELFSIGEVIPCVVRGVAGSGISLSTKLLEQEYGETAPLHCGCSLAMRGRWAAAESEYSSTTAGVLSC